MPEENGSDYIHNCVYIIKYSTKHKKTQILCFVLNLIMYTQLCNSNRFLQAFSYTSLTFFAVSIFQSLNFLFCVRVIAVLLFLQTPQAALVIPNGKVQRSIHGFSSRAPFLLVFFWGKNEIVETDSLLETKPDKPLCQKTQIFPTSRTLYKVDMVIDNVRRLQMR